MHHAVSKKIHRALQKSKKLKGKYKYRDPRHAYRAKTLEHHKGYDKPHRNSDDEIRKWIDSNPEASPKEFEDMINNYYNTTDYGKGFIRE